MPERLFVALVLVAVTQAGCLYEALGFKHNYAVAENLEPRMTRDEALATIADGGQISVEEEISRPASGEWADAVEDDGTLARLLLTQARERREVASILTVYRIWGFFGFGEFYLFFDSGDELVGFRLLHIN